VYLCLVYPPTGGAPSSTRVVQDCEKWIRSLEKNQRGRGYDGARIWKKWTQRAQPRQQKGRLPSKKTYSDAAGMTEHQWYGSVKLVSGSHGSLATQTTMEIEMNGYSGGEMSTALTSEANTTFSIHTNSLINNKEPNSPLTIDGDYLSDIEHRNDNEKYQRFVMVARNEDKI
jgi:hypothetical protein